MVRILVGVAVLGLLGACGGGTPPMDPAPLEDDPTTPPAPQFRVTSLSDASGTIHGGVPMFVYGSGFTDVESVTFGTLSGGARATNVQVNSTTEISLVTPPAATGKAGTVDVVVWNSASERALTPPQYRYVGWEPDDPSFAQQWHLQNTGQGANITAGEDIRVEGAWDRDIIGRGTLVCVMDDGLETAHEDLAANVVSGSWDYGAGSGDPTTGRHGTPCAGLIAAVGRNQTGVVGVAPGASLYAHVILDNGATDLDFADALMRAHVQTSVYSNSWERLLPRTDPSDASTAYTAFTSTSTGEQSSVLTGLNNGRGGRGSIYVKSSGNQREKVGMDANRDASNTWHGTVIVGGVAADGTAAVYSNPGANVLVCAPTAKDFNGAPAPLTTDRTGPRTGSPPGSTVHGGYTDGNYTGFNGTSASCPIAAGVVALMLEARPTLTWRDVYMILAESARRTDPGHPSWFQNAAGIWTSNQYGFGVVDSDRAVELARTWTLAGFNVDGIQHFITSASTIPDNNTSGLLRTFLVTDTISRVTYARVTLDISHPYALDLDIRLTSPQGTESVLVPSSSGRRSTVPGNRLYLVTNRPLGEPAGGVWTLRVTDRVSGDVGTLSGAHLYVTGQP